MKQTAVEWLIEELKKVHHTTETMIMYAKKLEKQQIIEAYKFGIQDEYVIGAKQYYNKTFKKD